MIKIDTVENNLGERLKSYRKKHGMTQGAIAKLLKISTDYVSKIEKGDREPNVHVREKIVELLVENDTSQDKHSKVKSALESLHKNSLSMIRDGKSNIREDLGSPIVTDNILRYSDPLGDAFLKDWKSLSEAGRMRVWALLKEEMEREQGKR